MKLAIRLSAFFLVAVSGASVSRGLDLENCRWPSGAEMRPVDCAKLRQREVQEAEAAKRQSDEREAERAARAQERERAAAARVERAAAAASAAEVSRRDEAARAEAAAELAAAQRAASERARVGSAQRQEAANQQIAERQLAAERDEAKRERLVAERRRVCGADFQTPRVGMSLARARECVGTLRLVAERATPSGTLAVYAVGPLHLSVQSGTVVSWISR